MFLQKFELKRIGFAKVIQFPFYLSNYVFGENMAVSVTTLNVIATCDGKKWLVPNEFCTTLGDHVYHIAMAFS